MTDQPGATHVVAVISSMTRGPASEVHRQFIAAPRSELSNTLLGHCVDRQPDLLVMGAYGHARLRDDLFRGVTRSILEKMNLPVLMSH